MQKVDDSSQFHADGAVDDRGGVEEARQLACAHPAPPLVGYGVSATLVDEEPNGDVVASHGVQLVEPGGDPFDGGVFDGPDDPRGADDVAGVGRYAVFGAVPSPDGALRSPEADL